MKDSYAFYKDKLNAEYKPAFEQVEMYVLTQNIDESTMEERMGELLDIFLSAQEAGKPVQKIVGSNVEQFCKTFCSDFGFKNRVLRILDWLKTVAWGLALISSIDIVWFLLDTEESENLDVWHFISSLNISVYFTEIILFAALFIVTNIVLRHFMFKTKRISMGMLRAVMCIEAGVSFVGIILLLNFCQITLFDVPAWIVALISVLYLLVYYPLFGKRNKRQQVKFSDLMQAGMPKEYADMMEKKFAKAKKKHLKKGKGELSFKEFLAEEEKSYERMRSLKIIYGVFPILVTAFGWLITYLSNGFDGYTDSVIFIVIMLVVEYLIILGLWKIIKYGFQAQKAWLQEKQSEIEQTEKAEVCEETEE